MPFAGYDDWEDCIADNQDKRDPQAYCGAIKNRVEGSGPNMSVEGMEQWRETDAYAEYREYHDKQDWADETVREISNRALRVIQGEATEAEREKVASYIARHKAQEAGERRFGDGNTAVSAHTAGLRNWGYDPTGQYIMSQNNESDSWHSERIELSILPKGSGCEEFKKVPAKSSYWRDETDAVTRCDKFATGRGSGSGDGPDDDSEQSDGDAGGSAGDGDGGQPDTIAETFDVIERGHIVSISAVETNYEVTGITDERTQLNIRGGDFFVADEHMTLSPVSDTASHRVLIKTVTGDIHTWPTTSAWDLKKGQSDGPVESLEVVEIPEDGEEDEREAPGLNGWERTGEDTYKLKGITHPLFGDITPTLELTEWEFRGDSRWQLELTIGPNEQTFGGEDDKAGARANAERYMQENGEERLGFELPNEVGDWGRTQGESGRDDAMYLKEGLNEGDANVPPYVDYTTLSFYWDSRKEKFTVNTNYGSNEDVSVRDSPSDDYPRRFTWAWEAFEEAEEYMREHPSWEPEDSTDHPAFEAEFSNRMLKPVMKAMDRMEGNGAYNTNLTVTEGGLKFDIVNRGSTKAAKVRIDDDGTMETFNVAEGGRARLPISDVAEIVTDERMSTTVRLTTPESGGKKYLRVEIDGDEKSPTEPKERLYFKEYDDDMGGVPDLPDTYKTITVPADDFRSAVRLHKYYTSDDSGIALVAGEDPTNLFLHHDGPDSEVHARVDGSTGDGGDPLGSFFSFEFLDDISVVVPRPASTSVKVTVADEHPMYARYEVMGTQLTLSAAPRIQSNGDMADIKREKAIPDWDPKPQTKDEGDGITTRANFSRFDDVFDVPGGVADEMLVRAQGESGLGGMRIETVDPANVVLTKTEVEPEAFDHYGTTRSFGEGERFGFWVSKYEDIRRLVSDSTTGEVYIGRKKGVIGSDKRKIVFSGIDPDNIRQPDIPEGMEFTVEGTGPVFELGEFVENAMDTNKCGQIALGGTSEDELFGVYLDPDDESGDGDFATRIGRTEGPPANWSIYNLGKFKKCRKSLTTNRPFMSLLPDIFEDKNQNFRLRTGASFPIKIDWDDARGDISHLYMQAPVVAKGEDEDERQENMRKRTERVRGAVISNGLLDGTVADMGDDLGQPDREELSTTEPVCPYSHLANGWDLSEPLQPGEQAPDIDGLDTDESVVWFFPNHDGCRCGHQAQQFDQLSQEAGVTVYGVADTGADELAQMKEAYGLGITLVSDPNGDIAEKFGVERTGQGFERRTYFIRDGQVLDVSDGVSQSELSQPGQCPIEQAEPPERANWCEYTGLQRPAETYLSEPSGEELYKQLKHPGVYVITGRRGAGKSALAMQIADKLSDSEPVTAVTVAMPDHVREKFPNDWVHVETLGDAPSNSVVVVDESYMQYNARTPLADENQSLTEHVETSRHCQQTQIYVTQNSALLDKTAVGEADGLLIKQPGALHTRFERRPIRELTEEAEQSFDQLPASLNRKKYAYLYTDEYQGMVENGLPDWYDDAVSRSHMKSCQMGPGE